jgi:rSAM/selenodomain-associated transferase 1
MSVAVIVLAKAPVAGLAKTRLAPALGAEGAAALAERMLVHAVGQAAAAGLGPVEICATPDTAHPVLQRLAAQHGATLSLQGDGDLGQRMHRALARALVQHGRALLMGADVPALDAGLLRLAAQRLLSHDGVFVPARDGGYALVGQRHADQRWFSGIPWSTPQVMQATRRRLVQAGVRWAELPPVADIDGPDDLVHLPAGWLP